MNKSSFHTFRYVFKTMRLKCYIQLHSYDVFLIFGFIKVPTIIKVSKDNLKILKQQNKFQN